MYAQSFAGHTTIETMSMGDQIAQQARTVGLFWKKDEETKADGNCFYNAVCQQILRPEINSLLPAEKREIAPSQLRKEVANFVKEIYHESKVSVPGGNAYLLKYEALSFPGEKKEVGLPSGLDFKSYLDFQERDASTVLPPDHQSVWYWATDLYIQATAVHLGIEIRLTTNSSSSQNPYQSFLPNFTNQNSKKNYFVALGAITNFHFQSLLPPSYCDAAKRPLNPEKEAKITGLKIKTE